MERFEVSHSTGDSRAFDDGAKFGHASGGGVQRGARPLHCRAAGPSCPRTCKKHFDTLGDPQPEQIKLGLKFRSDDLPILLPMGTHSAEEAVSQHGGSVGHWSGMEITRVLLAYLWADTGGHRLRSFSRTDACLPLLARAPGQHVSSRNGRARTSCVDRATLRPMGWTWHPCRTSPA